MNYQHLNIIVETYINGKNIFNMTILYEYDRIKIIKP